MDELNIAEEHELHTALHIASRDGRHKIVQMLLEYGDSMLKRNYEGVTPFDLAKSGKVKQVFVEHQRPLPCFKGKICEWNIAYRDPSMKSAQIRQYLRRTHFTNQEFATAAGCYVRCYLSLEGYPQYKLEQLETIGYASPDAFIRAYTSSAGLYEIINRHLVTYAMAYIDSFFDITVPYSLIHYLLSVLASILRAYTYRRSFKGCVFRGMLIQREDLDKYVMGSRILNAAFLSTSVSREVAEMFAGFHFSENSTSPDSSHIHALCSYRIQNDATAVHIQQLSQFRDENEVLIFPFSAFRITGVEKISRTVVKIQLEECDEQRWSEDDEF